MIFEKTLGLTEISILDDVAPAIPHLQTRVGNHHGFLIVHRNYCELQLERHALFVPGHGHHGDAIRSILAAIVHVLNASLFQLLLGKALNLRATRKYVTRSGCDGDNVFQDLSTIILRIGFDIRCAQLHGFALHNRNDVRVHVKLLGYDDDLQHQCTQPRDAIGHIEYKII